MYKKIEQIIQESIEVKKSLPVEKIKEACKKIISCYVRGNKLLVCGNGGSAADAQHMAGEFVNRFKIERNPLPCLALSTDTSVLTAIANDYSFDDIFSKQVEAYGNQDDILIGISTSGNSRNIIKAIKVAKEREIYTIGLLGNKGGKLGKICNLPIIVPSYNTPRIQEGHELIIHTICELVEKELCQKGLC